MQNENEKNVLKRHRSPINRSIDVSCERGREADSAASCTDDDGWSARSTATVQGSKRASKPGESAASLLRRCSRLPRPTASASNHRRDDHVPGGVRRTRRLSTLQGVVLNSPTYSSTRPPTRLIASIISKCRIPAPVTARRISSCIDCWNSQTAYRGKVDRPNPSASGSRAESLSLNFGDSSPTSGTATTPRNPTGNDASGSTTIPDVKGNVRFSPDAGKLRREHVCCGCNGTGLVSSHLLCIRTPAKTEVKMFQRRRSSPRARVYRFDASAGHSIAVARVAVEAGLEVLPSVTRRFDPTSDIGLPTTASGSGSGHRHCGDDRTTPGQVDDESQVGEMAAKRGNELCDSQLPEAAAVKTETETNGTLPPSSERSDQQPETAAAKLSTISGIPRPNGSKSQMCSGPDTQHVLRLSANSGAKTATSAPDGDVYEPQSVSTRDERKTAETEVTENSIDAKLRETARNCLTGSHVSPSPIKTTTISEEKSAVIEVDKVSVDAKRPTLSQLWREQTRRKWLGRGDVDHQNARRKCCYETAEASQASHVTI